MTQLTQSGTAQSSRPSGIGPSSAPRLRPYQSAAIHSVYRELESVRSTLVVAATGTGKTVTFAELARLFVSRGLRVLIVVHRDELIKQARRKCEAVGLWPDIEKGKQRANTLAKVVLCSVQSMRGARLTRWARDHFGLVIVDEAHHAAAASYQGVLAHFDAARVVGVTATPVRADGKALGETFETVAFSYDIRQAIADEYLVPIVARRVVVDSIDLRGVGTRAGDFAQDQLAEVMANERNLRGCCIPLLELAKDRPTIAFCVDVSHAEAVARVLNSLRPGCARAVSGETDDDEREALLAAHAAGEFQFLTNCDLLVEGYDAPVVSCVATLRPTQSWSRYVQQAGRGLRLLGDTYAASIANGKRDCLLLDMVGASKHALVGPADCLAGHGVISDEEREEIERQLQAAQLEISHVIAHAKREVEGRRAELRVRAVVAYHSEHVDPFVGAVEPGVLPPCDPAFETQPASTKQLERLDELGVTLSKLPKEFSRADAWRLIAQIQLSNRSAGGTYPQLRKLAQAGVRRPWDVPRDRVRALMNMLAAGDWRASAISGEPEVRGEVPVESQPPPLFDDHGAFV